MKYLILYAFFFPALCFPQSFDIKDMNGRWASENNELSIEIKIKISPDFEIKKMLPKGAKEDLPKELKINQDVFLISIKVYDKSQKEFIINDSAEKRMYRAYTIIIPSKGTSFGFLLIENEVENGRNYRSTLTLENNDCIRMTNVPNERVRFSFGEPAPSIPPIRIPKDIILKRVL